jgi:hypothetical protein
MMIEKQILRNLLLEVLKRTPKTQATSITNEVEVLVRKYDLFPNLEDCQRLGVDYHYYEEKNLSPLDMSHILEVIWDLITERVLTPGIDQSNVNFPFVSVTSFGQEVISQSAPHYYDPPAYIEYLKSVTQNLDAVVEQYVTESLNCFRRQLLFASAVMLGAAAEKAILLLLEAVAKSLIDPQKKAEAELLLEGGKLPAIFDKIMGTLEPLTKKGAIPYSVHQGCIEHLMSLFEMIRVQRNDAVHPTAGLVNRDKVFISIQTLPVALQLVYNLIGWLGSNSIP